MDCPLPFRQLLAAGSQERCGTSGPQRVTGSSKLLLGAQGKPRPAVVAEEWTVFQRKGLSPALWWGR